MQSPIPETRAAEAAQISQAVERFLANGGKVQRLPIMRGTELDSWRSYIRAEELSSNCKAKASEAKPPRKSPARPALHAAKAKRSEFGPVVVQMFDEGTSVAGIMRETGLGNTFITGRLKAAGRDPAANMKKRADPALIRQAQVMAEQRYTARYAAQILSTTERPVSEKTLLRIAKDHDFTFSRGKS